MTTVQNTEALLETNDLQITANHIGQLENADEVIRFFAQLGYDVDDATPVAHATLGLDGADVKLEIKEIRRVGNDPDLGDIVIYLMEVKSVTLSLVQKIARRFRTRPESALLVLTADYETLDFVLIDRTQEKSARIGQALKQVIRPRHLTVERRRPASVSLRVLRRFTYTEGDSLLQWEKLRSAYTLAERTEENFNNRALFADYYLKSRFVDATMTPAWGLDVKPIGREVYKLVVQARKAFSGQPEAKIRNDFYEPLFRLLGFDVVVNKPGNSDGTQPDYFLYAPGERDKPLAAALTYVWNRNLDDIDPNRDPDTGGEIPGALVVSTLEAGKAPWVITTNGKLWRLYATAADNKATNYYEVDLEEAFGASDQVTALKYWWLCFRAEAFTGFLDDVRRRSQEYATALGKRLKSRIFEEIFPHFAEGLIVQMRGEKERLEIGRLGIGEADAEDVGWRGDEIDLEQVFQATLTFLYRLMFVAYAESMELLPLTEAHGYGGVSLRRLKAEIAEKGGEIEDAASKQLARAYSSSATHFYIRLQQLFGAIDAGDPALNLPTYNGGLFSAETPAGRLLARYAIPDRFLALGLDRLCRDVDDKTHALVFVDFKSLGVRQLGSIYEGLLEFKLRIAAEKLAVVKEDGKELVVPYAKAKNRRVLATPLRKGEVYLENDKRERKATGSYYTPDYIVKYIVEHTVGPVLDRKFDELAPRVRDAQQRYRKAKEVAITKSEDPEKFWNDLEMQQLADACLDIKVLDPAMGSGHFLVEAVDFISDRLIDWLNGWTENPVWALLERIRRDILEDMERQQVTIPAERLVRVALLKRAVLKRCIYGVDLNAMAVELAFFDLATLWDMTKTQLPLMLTLYPERGRDLVAALLTLAEHYGEFPNGYVMSSDVHRFDDQASCLGHVVLAEAYARSRRANRRVRTSGATDNIDWHRALRLMDSALEQGRGATFAREGLVAPFTHTLDLAYASFLTAQLARELGDEATYDRLIARADAWRNAYDPATGLLRA
ncbi:MAG: glycoside hydrolase family 92 protein, partial [Caldilinea sp.]